MLHVDIYHFLAEASLGSIIHYGFINHFSYTVITVGRIENNVIIVKCFILIAFVHVYILQLIFKNIFPSVALVNCHRVYSRVYSGLYIVSYFFALMIILFLKLINIKLIIIDFI